ncbi:hypothetical protein [Actinomadura sp. DC4]|uniref:hypothetical protein n=1 Tax=Actinomadura sp. DC4 TaxID=3055069 RepID=UPI0025B1B532|nr:hypothetical protein [Actinomadura sp. DC4]MDN3351959.1 hypothetical protein [Actinomadura sp. DC4]
MPYAIRRPASPGDGNGYYRLHETFPAGHIRVIDDDSEDGTDEAGRHSRRRR